MKLLVFGYYGGRNFGDEMMLLGLLNGLETTGEKPEIQIINPTGAVPSHLEGRIQSAVPMRIGRVLKALRKSDAFIICGGTMFHDAYPDERHAGYRIVLAKLAALCIAAKFFGNKVGMVGVGIGPLKRDFTEKVTALALKACNFVAVRDAASLADVVKLQTETPVKQSHDLSLLAAHDTPTQSKKDKNKKHVVLSLVPENLVSSVSETAASEFLEELPSALSNSFANDPDTNISVLVVNQGAHDGDTYVSEKFYENLDENLRERTTLIPFDGNPVKYLDVIKSADIIAGMRFHVAVVSSVLQKPTIWIPYQRKVSDGAESLGADTKNVVLPDGKEGAQTLAAKICDALENGLAPSASNLTSAKKEALINIDMLCDELSSISTPKAEQGAEYLEDLTISPPPKPAKVKVDGK